MPARLVPRKKPRQTRSRSLVDAIVVAASRVLAERGWDGFAMKEVAALAGVSPGSLYQYFPDRAALVAELVERLSQREVAFHASRGALVPPNASLEEVLDVMIRSSVEFQSQEGPFMREALRAMPHIGRYAGLVARVEAMREVIRQIVGPRVAHLPPREVDLALHVLINAVQSLTHDGILARPDWLDDATLIDALRRLVRGYLGPAFGGKTTA